MSLLVPTLQGRPDFSFRCATFASAHVADLVLDRLSSELCLDLRLFLVASSDVGAVEMAGLRGVLFERYGHKRLLQGGFQCKWRQLHPPSRKRKQPPPAAAADDDADIEVADDLDPITHHYTETTAQQQQQQPQPRSQPQHHDQEGDQGSGASAAVSR